MFGYNKKSISDSNPLEQKPDSQSILEDHPNKDNK